MYGHVEKLARAIQEGAKSIEGVKVEIWRHEETLSDDVLAKMYAPKKADDIPVLTYDKLDEVMSADGFLFGMPTRFGMMATQCKTFWDSTGKYWMSKGLYGKLAGTFFSTGSQGGGQETTALTAITQFAHHGMIYVPMGYGFGQDMFALDQVRGGSAYGAGTYSGVDGSRQPSELEIKIAKYQGTEFAKFVKKLA